LSTDGTNFSFRPENDFCVSGYESHDILGISVDGIDIAPSNLPQTGPGILPRTVSEGENLTIRFGEIDWSDQRSSSESFEAKASLARPPNPAAEFFSPDDLGSYRTNFVPMTAATFCALEENEGCQNMKVQWQLDTCEVDSETVECVATELIGE